MIGLKEQIECFPDYTLKLIYGINKINHFIQTIREIKIYHIKCPSKVRQ